MAKLAFIGLGVMGYPMAGHLANAGHEVTVYNRTTSTAEKWVAEFGGTMAPSPAEAAGTATVAFSCVGNDDDVRQVITGNNGALGSMQPGSILVDHTTASADLAREISRLASERSVSFIDAPVSGGQQGADNAALTIMCGGDNPAFEKVFPFLDLYSRSCMLMGPSGSGQLTKMVNQVCITGLIESLSEALLFAEKSGLDPHQVIEVISKGAAQSWQMENRHKTMLAGEYEHGFAVQWMRKDLDICFRQAEKMGIELPVARLVDGYYSEVEAMGGSRWDTSSLFARLKKHFPGDDTGGSNNA